MPDTLALPPPPADPASLAPGTVIVQWAVQDGCWQLPQSWQAGGTLPQGQVRGQMPSGVLGLPPTTCPPGPGLRRLSA